MTSSAYLQITFPENLGDVKDTTANQYESRNLPFSNSVVFLAPVEEIQILTQGDDVKQTYDLKLSLQDCGYDFSPGDTVGILPSNDESEVDAVLARLSIEHIANNVCKLDVLPGTTKKNPAVPKHIPSVSTLRNIFLNHIDIRSPPKKLFIKSLVCCTTDEKDRAKLEALTSPKGSKDYIKIISGEGRTLLGFLDVFRSCLPAVETILEHSAPLQPRPYSVASSPLLKTSLHITFFILDELGGGRKGVCTGWLQKHMKPGWNVPIYFRKPNTFRYPIDVKTPIIMIATGTGLAPFRGFLQHRSLLAKNSQAPELGEALLFYGCRYTNRDFLYKRELQAYCSEGILTKLYPAFSRDSASKCYVQHKLKEYGEEFFDYFINKKARVFVCGDAKTMMKCVRATIVELLVEFGGLEPAAAEDTLMQSEKQGRYIIDIWM